MSATSQRWPHFSSTSSQPRRGARLFGAARRLFVPALVTSGLLALGTRFTNRLADGNRFTTPETAVAAEADLGLPLRQPVAPARLPAVPRSQRTAGPELAGAERSDASELVLAADGEDPEVHVFPPSSQDQPARIVLMLHGMCSEPEAQCDVLAPSLTSLGWLVCPRATLTCPDGDATWKEDPQETVERALFRAQRSVAGFPDPESEVVLVGFSLGALRAVTLIENGTSFPVRSLILIGARVSLATASLERAGIEQIVLAAGELDLARDHMRWQSRKLQAEDFAARYLDLGNFGHELNTEVAAALDPGLDWLAGDGSCASCD